MTDNHKNLINKVVNLIKYYDSENKESLKEEACLQRLEYIADKIVSFFESMHCNTCNKKESCWGNWHFVDVQLNFNKLKCDSWEKVE